MSKTGGRRAPKKYSLTELRDRISSKLPWKEQRRRHTDETRRVELAYGANLSFAASEAYRLLRTNLSFALPDENKCRIIGITSANAGEGKSMTALNLSYMLAESNKTVMLIEGDMRLPTISKRLGVDPAPGLSNMLAGLNSGKEVVRDAGLADGLLILPAGDIPPNPSELLGSEQMKTALEVFSQMVDYIVLDLPPINEVADALVISRIVDGMVVVVRQNYTSRRSLADAMRQMEQANAKVLGFVISDADTLNKWGGAKKYKYNKYKSRYGYGYGYGHYAHSQPQGSEVFQYYGELSADEVTADEEPVETLRKEPPPKPRTERALKAADDTRNASDMARPAKKNTSSKRSGQNTKTRND